jgi:hypothetical protein
VARSVVAFRVLPRRFGRLAFFGRRQVHAGAPGFGQADCDRLLGRACAVLAFAHVLDLLANELTGLRGGRFAFALVFRSALQCFFVGHECSPYRVAQHIARPVRSSRRLYNAPSMSPAAVNL